MIYYFNIKFIPEKYRQTSVIQSKIKKKEAFYS